MNFILLTVTVVSAYIGYSASKKANLIEEENIKLRLDNNVLKASNKDLESELKSFRIDSAGFMDWTDL